MLVTNDLLNEAKPFKLKLAKVEPVVPHPILALMGGTPLLGTLWPLVVAVAQEQLASPDNLGDQEAVLLAQTSVFSLAAIVVLLVELGLRGKDILAGLLITFANSTQHRCLVCLILGVATKVAEVEQAALVLYLVGQAE